MALPPQSTDTSIALNKRRAQVAKYAKLLLGCFRTGDATDPEVYAGAVIAVLADYPDDVIEQVVDPRNGLPSRMNWLPTIAEIKTACEDLYGHRRRAAEWDEAARKQLAADNTLRITDERPRKTYEDLKADCHARGIFIGEGRIGASQSVDIGALCEAHGVSKEQWDAIPNAGDYDIWLRSQGLKR